jgi:polysaccharide biosynthesis protein
MKQVSSLSDAGPQTASLKKLVLSGVFWQGLSNGGSFAINFVITVILARLLMPEDFGIVAIISVFIAVFGVFIDSGFSSALIQRKDLRPEDCSSVFFVNLVIAGTVYALLFVSAPWIADFYNRKDLTLFIRVLALVMIIRSFSIVQGTLITRNMQFHLNFRISLISLILSGSLGVLMAFQGFGAWALITQTLCGGVITCLLQWYWGKWRPILKIDFRRLKEMFQFGWKLLCSAMLDCVYNNLYSILIGKLFNLSILSFYDRGKHIPNSGIGIINTTLGQVLFPAFSTIQDNKEKLRILMQKSLKTIMFLVIPVLAMLFVLAEPLVMVLYGEKWLSAVPFLQIFCIVFLFWPLHTINLQLLTACGRSDVFLILEIIKKVQIIPVILLTYPHGVIAMATGSAVMAPIGFIENAWMSKKLANYGTLKQSFDLLPILGIAIVSAIAAWLSIGFIANIYFKVIAGGLVFGIIYLTGTLVCHQIPEDGKRIIFDKISLKKVFIK